MPELGRCRDLHRRRMPRQSGPRRLGRDPALSRGREGIERLRAGHDQQPHGDDGGDSRARGAETAVPGPALQRQPISARRHHEMDPRLEAAGLATADKQPVKNVDLWQRLDAAAARHVVSWEWVRGHAGHPENERADALARAASPKPTGIRPILQRTPQACEGIGKVRTAQPICVLRDGDCASSG